MSADRRWLLRCMRRGWWWRANSAGYTEDVKEAGRYTDSQALDVVERTTGGDSCVQIVPDYCADQTIYVASGVKERTA